MALRCRGEVAVHDLNFPDLLPGYMSDLNGTSGRNLELDAFVARLRALARSGKEYVPGNKDGHG